ncbi:zinc/manganese transport system ATP-binding protein [Actinoplanes tereljensis]|uniref:ABC transporter ATP-binding protein n=1 Tax=Paractinoplanes tereljensis TaxID=571912 RepID=A0A919NTK5_9ACTN|nr:metal ABC transporter ATP-binding protein [Actinoplanes tereljensis]GIF23537.1 ABC transporter ATP-binding protein [Actinoplanes tereljensis]
MTPILAIDDATLNYGSRRLWSHLDLTVRPGEFVAVLGANGSGKTSLLRVLLGRQRLTSGTVTIAGRPAHRGSKDIGYVPQQRRIDTLTPLRARDLVGLGLDGHRWGLNLPGGGRRRRIDAVLGKVGADAYADRPVWLLSGGEQQRVRIAQALVAEPALLLCDEPLLSLDPRSQQEVTALVDERRRAEGTAVLFVTHEINPVLPYADRVLWLADGRFRIGTVDEVLTSEVLSEMYRTQVDVIRTGDRVLVAGLPDPAHFS